MTETELKFRMDLPGLQRAQARLALMVGTGHLPAPQLLRSVYYDTPDQALRGAEIALRLRQTGESWEQTVKAASTNHGGLQRGVEDNSPAPDAAIDLTRIGDPDLRQRIADLADPARLSPVFETAMHRIAVPVTMADGSVVEVALDRGDIRAGTRALPFHELELELKSGGIGALFDAAAQLLPDGGLRLSGMSKAERGFRLASDGTLVPAPAPRTACTVAMDKDTPVNTALRDILRECFDQIATNAETVREIDDPEGPHQLRIGLRRLRSALAVFRPALDRDAIAPLTAEARWLAQEVGALRDLDVAAIDLLTPEARACPNEPGFPVLLRALQIRTDARRAALRAVLTGPRCQSFLLGLARSIETEGWRGGTDPDRDRMLDGPVDLLARQALAHRWKNCTARAAGIETLSLEGRHALRKELKKLRYAVEFFDPLLPRKRKARFLKRLKTLQNIFGDLNDLHMAETLFLAPGAPGAGDPNAQRALGRVLGSRAVRADAAWHDARALWHDLSATKPCW